VGPTREARTAATTSGSRCVAATAPAPRRTSSGAGVAPSEAQSRISPRTRLRARRRPRSSGGRRGCTASARGSVRRGAAGSDADPVGSGCVSVGRGVGALCEVEGEGDGNGPVRGSAAVHAVATSTARTSPAAAAGRTPGESATPRPYVCEDPLRGRALAKTGYRSSRFCRAEEQGRGARPKE
jgi:hypothetical protein